MSCSGEKEGKLKTSMASRGRERKPPFVDMVQNSTWKGRLVQKNVAAAGARLLLSN